MAKVEQVSEQRSPIDVRCYRANSWMQKIKEMDEKDLDSKFIFAWIAFNALYGQPKYLDHREGPESKDIVHFLSLINKLDTRGQIQTFLQTEPIRGFVYDLTVDNYLNDGCWTGWYTRKLEAFSLREKNAFPKERRGTPLENLFLSVYVLRKQLFHGCSSNKGSKNREALSRSVKVLNKLIPIFIQVISANSTDARLKSLLDDLPYPPTQGGTG